MKIEQTKSFTLTLTEDEFNNLRQGIGRTSIGSREKAGMTEQQSRFFRELYDHLCIITDKT